MNVLGAICLVDRNEGASQLLKKECDCDLVSIFTLDELVDYKKSQSATLETMAVG
jgi:orotate phosphoribosyltransferase